MNRFISMLGALALLSTPFAASAQNGTPNAATVPWVATQPAIPHDILSGVQTTLKGAEIGQIPQAGAQAFGPITSITIESLTTCNTTPQNFSLNGTAVGTLNVNNAHCTCNPPTSTATINDAGTLAAWDSSELTNNTAAYAKANGTIILWAAMSVTDGNGVTKRVCLTDRSGGDCTTTNLCQGHTSAATNESATFGQGASLDYFGTTFEWNFGDGTSTGPQAIVDPRRLEATKTYNAAPGTPFVATLTVCDANNQCDSAQYPMTVRADTLESRVNVAIDEGLWYLYTKAQASGQIIPDGSHGNLVSATASSVNAFEVHGHLESLDRDENPYVDVVAGGLDYIMEDLQSVANSAQQAGNPDSNGNGTFLTIASRGREVYEVGMLMDAIVASGNPNAVADTGVAAGSTYGDVVQDLIDGYAQGQMDNDLAAPQRGSWYYNYTQVGHADNSSSQWAAIGMIPAERQWGLNIPQFVKDENLIALNGTFRQVGAECGTFGYRGNTSPTCLWGCAATTPSGMVQLVMDGVEEGDIPGAPFAPGIAPYDAASRWMAENWGAGAGEGNTNLVTGYTYGMFAAVKALRLAEVDFLIDSDAGCGAGGNETQFDWYNDPNTGVATTLVDRQNANGSFGGPGRTNIQGQYTQWSLIMLAPQLFQQGPKAVAEANPTTVTINQTVNLAHVNSFHLDANQNIVQYDWDLDNDGQFDDYSTADPNAGPTTSYAAVGTYTVRLRVTDDNDPALTDSAEVQIIVSVDNVPPVAVIDPANSTVAQNAVVNLDGSSSFDPNAGPPLNDFIAQYEWDLDPSDGLTQFVVGGDSNSVSFANPGTYQVALRVTDSGPGGTQPLTNVTFATIEVLDNQPPVAVAEPDGATYECTGPAGADVTLNGSSSSDPDGDVLTYSWDPAAGLDDATAAMPTGTFALGAHNATLTVSDGTASDSDGASFEVVDTTGPTVVCDDQVAECTGVSTDVATGASATDLCAGDVAANIDNAGPYALGDTQVTYTADDGNGNGGMCMATISVVDTTDPTIECFDGNAECTGALTAVAISAAGGDTCDPMVDLSGDNPGAFPLGDTGVDFTATDDSDNSASCTATATVVDTTAPDIACTSASAECAGPLTDVAVSATATDVCEGDLATTPDNAGPYGLGDTTVTFGAADSSNNANSCQAIATVVDTTAPVISCPADVTVETDAGACTGTADPQATATDECEGDLATSRDPAGNTWDLGDTTVTHSTADSSGNPASCQSTVTVIDVTPPTIECNAHDITPPDAPITFTPTADDNCSVEYEITAYDCWKINGAGVRKSKLESCEVAIAADGQSVTINDSGGVGDNIEWTVVATDGSGNVTQTTCAIVVNNPGGGNGGGGDDEGGCNQGVGNGAEDCDPGNSNQGNPDNTNDEHASNRPGNPGKRGGKK